jgi:hypothetical protein
MAVIRKTSFAAQIIFTCYYETEESLNRVLSKLKSLHRNTTYFLQKKKVVILPSELQAALPSLQLTRLNVLTETLK